MKLRATLSLAALLAFTLCVSARDKPAKPGCFQITGETVDDIKLVFSHPAKPDLSTPEGAVAAWCAITDSRQEFEVQERTALYRWQNAATQAMEADEKALLDDTAIAAEKKNRERVAEIRKRASTGGSLPVKITETTKLDDGRVVATGIATEHYEHDGEVEEYTTPVRYTVKKCEDGKWRIDVVEIGIEDEDEDGKAKLVWNNDFGALEFFYTYIGGTDALKDVPALKQDTPESAALSLTGALSQRTRLLETRYYEIVMQPYVKAIESLCTPGWQQTLKESAGVGKVWPAIKPRAVDSIRDSADGVKIVRMKPQKDWNGPLEVYVVKVGEVWKVQAAYRVKLPATEGDKEQATKLASIYDAQWN